jgi:hypothetical protein
MPVAAAAAASFGGCGLKIMGMTYTCIGVWTDCERVWVRSVSRDAECSDIVDREVQWLQGFGD